MSEEEISGHILVSGRVQGVLFRAHTQDVACSLSLVGWVKNRKDGKVEVYCEGKKESVEKLIDWCRKGPSSAKVSDIELKYGEPTHKFEKFEIRYCNTLANHK
ncbi:acylphosphatase [bacterium]|nr:acylphosphatase [bacterium]